MPKNDVDVPYNSAPMSGDPRRTEAWALTEAARRIKLAQEDSKNIQNFLDTLRLNWRLWTIFQAELSSADSPVPVQIRQNMLSLCNFVDRVTVDIIASGEAVNVEDATPLININRQLARGLLGQATDDDSVSKPTNIDAETNKSSAQVGTIDEKI